MQDYLTFAVSGSCGCQPFLFRKCHVIPTRIGAMTLQNPLYADEYRSQVSPSFIVLVFPELQAPFSPRRPSCRVVVIIKVAMAFLVFLFWPPEVLPRLCEVQQHVSLVFQLVAALAVELHFDGGTELWFAAYPGTAATEFGAIPLPAPARSKPQPHGTCHSLCGLTLVALLEENVAMLSGFIRRMKIAFHILHFTFRIPAVKYSLKFSSSFLNVIKGKFVADHVIKICVGVRGKTTHVFKPGTGWICMISFSLSPLYPNKKNHP